MVDYLNGFMAGRQDARANKPPRSVSHRSKDFQYGYSDGLAKGKAKL